MRRLLVLLLVAGCNVGPKYKRPDLPKPPSAAFKENTAGSEDAQANGWRQANPSDEVGRGKWWQIFGDPALDALEERLVVDNQNVKVAFENYMAARALVRNARAALYPKVSIGPVNGSVRGGNDGPKEAYDLPLTASWEPDLWGRIRNTILRAENNAQVSAAILANQTLSEQASLAILYFQIRGQDQLLVLFNRTIENYKESVRLVHVLARTGIDSGQDVAQAEVTLHTAEAQATAVATTRAVYEHAIAVLLGEVAGNFTMPSSPLETKVPQVPLGVPSKLLERRPDIASAERTMAAANALIGVGKAAFYPNLTLSAGIGTQASSISDLFSAGSNYWTVGGSSSVPIIDFGARRATVDQYEAQYRSTVATYRQTVLSAFREVEDYLVQARQLAEQAERQKRAVTSAEDYERMANTRYKVGVDTYLNVITAQTSLLTNRETLVSLDTNRMVTAARLIAALGGGWNARDIPSESDVGKK